MRTSIIFFKNGKNYTFQNYDCCQSLGDDFMRKHDNKMFVGLPKKEMDEFFMTGSNLASYLAFITEVLDIQYSLASDEDVSLINMAGCSLSKEELIFVKIETKNAFCNKYFLVPYNLLRYLWYQQYTGMAIIATNLYNLKITDNVMDILAIAISYQIGTDRALLPIETSGLKGLLFSREKSILQRELKANTAFNSIIYRYPVFFDPEVKVRGSFFSEVEMTIKAKEMIAKLVGVSDVNDIPSSMRSNLKLVYEDYVYMKDSYNRIVDYLTANKYALYTKEPTLLSRGMKKLSLTVALPTGGTNKISIDFNSGESKITKEKEKEVELPF